MDGANRWRRMWHITLPALRPVVALLLVLRVGNALTVGFEQILLQRTAVGPGASEVLDTYVWNDRHHATAGLQLRGGRRHSSRASSVCCWSSGANKVAHLMGEQGVYKK